MVGTAGHLTHKALTGIDIAIIAVYFTVIFGIGFYFARKERTSTDYFLASRDVGWFAIGASLFLSNRIVTDPPHCLADPRIDEDVYSAKGKAWSN